MLKWFKKKSVESKNQEFKDWGSNPFEILLPEHLANVQVDLRMASKFLDLLRNSDEKVQSIEVTGVKHLVLSNNAPVRDFMTMVNGAKQFHVFMEQLKKMLFQPRDPNDLGQLCCLVEGKMVEFSVRIVRPEPKLRLEFTRVENA